MVRLRNAHMPLKVRQHLCLLRRRIQLLENASVSVRTSHIRIDLDELPSDLIDLHIKLVARIITLLHRDVRERDQQRKLVGAREAAPREKHFDLFEKVELEFSSRR